MSVEIDFLVEAGDWPDLSGIEALVRRAVDAALDASAVSGESELSVVLTDDAHIRRLNGDWRAKDKPTNVLSFPAFPAYGTGALPPLLGDIVLAYETIRDEAVEQAKSFEHHLTHLVVHGLLHLLGHDHLTDDEAEVMEGMERRILDDLAIPDPYR